jgi:hypothetical protein
MIFSRMEFEEFLGKLSDEGLRTILRMRREGYAS